MTERDPVLGAALRAALEAGDDRAFVAGVRARLADAPSWWEVLGRWARPGLAAAVVLMALAGMWLARGAGDAGPWDEPMAAAAPGSAAALLVAERPPTVDAILGAAQPR